MKKKFYNGLLLVAMIFATVGSFVSCKDYNEDLYAELQGTLTDRINDEVATLTEQIEALQQAQEACKENCQSWQEQMEIWVEWAKNNYVTKQEFNDSIASLAGKIATNKAEIERLEDKIDAIEAALKAADEALRGDIADLVDADLNLQQQITDLYNTLTTLQTTVTNNYNELKTRVDANSTLIAVNTAAIGAISMSINDLQDKVKTLESDLAKTIQDVINAHELAKADSIRIDALENELEALRNEHNVDIDSIAQELNTIKESVNAAVELANENLEKANEYTNMLISSVVERIKQTNERIDATNLRVDQIEAAYQAADKELQDQIDELKTDLKDLEDRVAENKEDIEELFGKFKNVEEALKQFITGILIQGTENPVIGSYSLPVNIQSNVLMSYYGYAGSYGVEFPTYYPRYYVRESETLSQKDIDMLGIAPTMLAQDGEAIVSGAGKIYVTVNPSNVNFEGQTLPIVNSIEEESGIKLSPLAYSDKKLTFGYTRSAANGLYEAEATLAPEDIEKVAMKFDFDAAQIKQTVKDVLTPQDGVNVTQVANTVIDVMNQFNQKLDANALKATWTDSLGVTRSVYSQYNLATTAVKPLSYSFMKDANYTSFPGFDQMRNFAGKLVDKVANKVKVVMPDASTINLSFSNLEKISFEAIEINTEGIDVTLQYDTIINIPGGVVTDEYGNIIGEYDDTNVDLWITMEPDSFKDLLKEIEILEDDINNMLNEEEDAINKIIDQINSYLDELGKLQDFADQLANIDNKVDETATDVKNKIIEYLDKIENKLLSAVNSANKALQPVLLVKTTDGVQRVSQTIYEPTWMTAGDVQFVPTSYTAELIAPSYKKLVGVTNVYSMDRSKNAQDNGGEYLTTLNEANSKAGVAEVLDGNTLVVDFTAEKGYIYEVTYTSVDYSGMVVAKKFYVTVK
ncbi:MAG: hypothetical protein J6L03_01145 [Bacteroidaceae bacterium]|nr:hypothetical protein [Bacteroidaceae bacterium]